MNLKYTLAGALFLLALGYGIGRYVQPPTEVTKVEVQEKEVIRKDVVTIVKEVVRKDGTKEIVTEIIDRTTEKKDKNQELLISKPTEKQWHLSVGYGKEKLYGNNVYQLTVERRILLDIYAGVTVTNEKTVGVTLGYEF